MRLTLGSNCRASSITVTAQLTIGGAVVTGSRALAVEWLTAMEVKLYYQDASTEYTASELKYRYGCSSPSPTFHSLKIKTRATLNSGAQAFVQTGAAYTVAGASLSGSGETRTLSVSSAGAVGISVFASPNPDAISNSVSLVAAPEPDVYTFQWALGLTSSTVYSAYGGSHGTTPTLHYSSGYVETISSADRPALITFSSSDSSTIALTTTGQLQPQKNTLGLGSLSVNATFCDAQAVSHSGIYSNLQYSVPFDYDLGQTYGRMVEQTGSQVCIPIKLYSQRIVDQFQFVLSHKFRLELAPGMDGLGMFALCLARQYLRTF